MTSRKGLIRTICIAGTLLTAAVGMTFAADWPQLNGPNGDGTVSGAGLPEGTLRLQTLWKKSLGSGYSGIAVSGSSAVTLFTEGSADHLAAFNVNTGDRRWTVELEEAYQGHDGSDDGPLSTPLIHEGRVFAVSARGLLIAVSLQDGKTIWSKQLTDEFEAPDPDYGFATSPVIAGAAVVVQVGGPDGKSLCAFDPADGKLRWKLGDEPAGYQTPAAVDVAGVTHLVMVSSELVRGVDPSTGKALWERTFDEENRFGSVANTVPVGGGRFLVTGWEKGRLFEIVAGDDGFTLEDRWSTSEIKHSYVAPVPRDGLLFGYSGSYLTAVDIATGERVWKSRPPGKGVPIGVGDHLVIWAKGGTVHVGPASRDGFTSTAHVEVLGTSSLTAPSFADGKVFVRNLDEIAAVAIRKGPSWAGSAESAIPALTASSEFGKLIANLDPAGDRGSAIDRYLKSRGGLPLVEAEGLVHFVYRGEGEDVGIFGTFTPRGSDALQRVEGSDVFYRSYRLDPGSRVEYGFIVDFGEEKADAGNPLAAPGPEGRRSELRMPHWESPDFAVAPFDGPRGELQTFEIASEAMGDTRKATVYLPFGYAESTESYPLLLVMDLNGALDHGRLPEITDRLRDAGSAPVIVAYVPFSPGFGFWEEAYASKRDDMVRFVVDELTAELDKRFRVKDGREHRTVLGAGWAAFPALYLGVNRSTEFGKVAALSLTTYGPLNEKIGEFLAATNETPRLEIYAGWGAYDFDPDYEEHVDLPQLNREIVAMLSGHRHDVTAHEIQAGMGWGSWWAHLPTVMKQLIE